MRIAYIIDQGIAYYRRVLRGVAQFVRSRGNLELRIEYYKSPEMFGALDRAGYDGLIMGTYADGSREAARLRTPAVSVGNNHPGLRFAQVVSDDREVGRMVARHLLAKGYRSFAFWGGQVVFADQRWSGFSSTIVGARGEEFLPAHNGSPERTVGPWLSSLPRPLGLMTVTDSVGSDAIDACHDLGRRVPEDVAVVGVDDDDLYAELTNPPLSSVALQTERIGFLAAESLMRLVQGEKVPQVTLVPPGALIARQSSRAVATGDTLVAQAVAYLEQNLARTSIDEMAEKMGVSRRSLELRFKAALGLTPGQELLRLRIDRAQSLLATTSLPRKQIATLCGFGKPVRMSQVFRRYTGQTPMSYRRGFLPH